MKTIWLTLAFGAAVAHAQSPASELPKSAAVRDSAFAAPSKLFPDPVPGQSRRFSPRYQRPVSMTLSMVNLLWLQTEVAVEYSPMPLYGIGILGGGGINPGEAPDSYALEAGVFGHWYPEYLSGFFLGAEAFRARLDFGRKTAEDAAPDNWFGVWGAYDVTGAGPLIGYKSIRKSGFTAQAQIGFYLGIFSREGRDAQTFLWPTLDVNLGWSF